MFEPSEIPKDDGDAGDAEVKRARDILSQHIGVLEYRIRELGDEPVGGTALDRIGRRFDWVMNRVQVVCEWVRALDTAVDDPRLIGLIGLDVHIDTLGSLVNDVKTQLV